MKPIIKNPCPVCGDPLNYDEVDIGVGIQRNNYRCESCGWYPKQDDEMLGMKPVIKID